MNKLSLSLALVFCLHLLAFSQSRNNAGTEIAPWNETVAQSANLNGAGHANQVLTPGQLEDCSTLVGCVLNKLPGILHPADPANFDNYQFARNSAKFASNPVYIKYMLDGAWVSGDLLNSVNVHDVATIEVLSSSDYLSIYGAEASGGLLIVTTKKGAPDDDEIIAAKHTPGGKQP